MTRRMAPIEWLRRLEEDPAGSYRSLLDETGSLALAAHRVARARCETWGVSTHVPTMCEVRAAAREIVERMGLGGPIPAARTLAFDCEAAGLPVL